MSISPRICGVLMATSAVSLTTCMLPLLTVMLAKMLGCVVRPRFSISLSYTPGERMRS